MAGGMVIFSSLGLPSAWDRDSAIQERNALIERPMVLTPHLCLQFRQDRAESQQAEILVFGTCFRTKNCIKQPIERSTTQREKLIQRRRRRCCALRLYFSIGVS